MKILWGILIGLVGISFGLAFAFLSSDGTITFDESMKMIDMVQVVKNG